MQIDKSVPLPHMPVRTGKNGRPAEYPWAEMAVGDSLHLPRAVQAPGGSFKHFMRKNPGTDFVARRDPSGGFRVWRVA